MPGHLQDGFGCVVTNRFDQLLDDESDPFDILKAAESRRRDAAAAAPKPAAQAARQPKKESQKERKNPPPEKKDEPQPAAAPPPKKDGGVRRVGRKQQQQQDQHGQNTPHQQGAPGDRRPERRVPRERRFEKPPEEKHEGGEGSVDKFSSLRPVGDRPPRGRGGGRGGRGGRGRGIGRPDGFDSRGKREFDRHSGNDKSSQKVEEKRGGAGTHNWGNTKEEASELHQSAAPEAPAEGEEPAAPVDSENKENEVEEVKEEGPKEMTLDEWKAMQNKERAKVEFNIRKPNEGYEGQWKKGYVLHKSKSKDLARPPGTLIEAGDANAESLHKGAPEDGSGDHHFRKPANDITSQLEINFGDLGRPGRGRGGSRGGRGGRGGGNRAGRGGGRSEKGGGVSVPNVDDPEAFPALA
ncbi:SERPINE1 mRNA-binding protein 1-like isoform 1-T1 [Clarias gariepinus]|uniref:plasminogen activator inhibitor 1 RNA-binding protein-like isoform X1 n=1 Tax=Clarias gariepinus TaxID=13013 RepID=UPI00234D7B18|nr:plasminogen activator inhibitor 1 RNA-binding protein-like isoform X1 [Clarias gariepinus]